MEQTNHGWMPVKENSGWTTLPGEFPCPSGDCENEMPEPPVIAPPIIELPEDIKPCNPLAMVFINTQEWGETYEVEDGMTRGTIFPDLDFPFLGGGASR